MAVSYTHLVAEGETIPLSKYTTEAVNYGEITLKKWRKATSAEAIIERGLSLIHILKKEWLATLDNRTRHAHAMLDGQQADVDKPFKVDGEEIRYPGDSTAAGHLVYNCRCTLVAAVDGVDTSDALRRDEYGPCLLYTSRCV